MKHHWKVSLILVGLLLIGGLIYAQVPRGGSPRDAAPHRDEKTAQLLSLARSLYEELNSPEAKSTCRLSYSIEVIARGQNDSLYTKASDIRYEGSADHIQVESSDASLYQDSAIGVTVIVPSREIRIFTSSPSKLKATRAESMKTFRDDLFAKSSVDEYEVKGREHRLRLTPTEDFRKWYGIEQVTIALIPEERRIVSIGAEFSEREKYKSMMMDYGRLECSDVPRGEGAMEFSSLDKVFDANGNLRPTYQGYAVTDLRPQP